MTGASHPPMFERWNVSDLLAAWEEGATHSPVWRALRMLRMASPEPAGEDWARAAIGKRDGALMDWREQLFGSRWEAVVGCPECGCDLEMAFETRDIHPVSSLPAPGAERILRVASGEYEITFRLPNSIDVVESPGTEELFKRCLVAVMRNGVADEPALLPPNVVDAVVAEMERADPEAVIEFWLTCPRCSHRWAMPFDAGRYFWREIEDWARAVMTEVHRLAAAYGWSEREILEMTPRRRRLYLEMAGA